MAVSCNNKLKNSIYPFPPLICSLFLTLFYTPTSFRIAPFISVFSKFVKNVTAAILEVN